MLSIYEVIAELDGNGYDQREILEISNELTKFALMKGEISAILKDVYDPVEIEEMLGIIKVPTRQQKVLSNSLESFSKREKQCYIMHTVDSKSFTMIGKELGVSKSTVQQSIERARKKIELSQQANEPRNAL